jgi:hypothetical protein
VRRSRWPGDAVRVAFECDGGMRQAMSALQ